MWYLYLDESGDLGFDFANKKSSNFFTITILLVKGIENNRALVNAVKKTIKRKLNPKGNRRRIVEELKGQKTTFSIKEYFYKQLTGISFELYCMTMDKRLAFAKLAEEKHRVYNFLASLVLEQIPLK